MDNKTEEDRMIAVLKGNFLARHFPQVWKSLEEHPTGGYKLKEQLLKKFVEMEKKK